MEKPASSKKNCELCCEKTSKYCCPRCNLLYCSLECYRSEQHAQCSESFYRECVLNDISENDNKSKQKITDILKRLNENNDLDIDDSVSNTDSDNTVESDDEEHPDLLNRLSALDLNNAELIWDNLTNDERQEFESLLNSGEVAKFIPEWKPWWEREQKLVEEVEDKIVVDNCPAININVKPIDVLTKNTPSPFVRYNIINVLGAYVVTIRHFNGEHHDNCLESATCLINISENLLCNKNYPNSLEALKGANAISIDKNIIENESDTFLGLAQDIEKILAGNYKEKSHYIKCALSDTHKLLSGSLRILKSDTKIEDQKTDFSKRFKDFDIRYQKPSKANLKLYLKKIEYYLSYVKSYSSDFVEINIC